MRTFQVQDLVLRFGASRIPKSARVAALLWGMTASCMSAWATSGDESGVHDTGAVSGASAATYSVEKNRVDTCEDANSMTINELSRRIEQLRAQQKLLADELAYATMNASRTRHQRPVSSIFVPPNF